MKWQNLKVKRCPKCESPLEKEDKKQVFVCTKCDFVVTGRKVMDMILDPESPLRKYEHPEESKDIRQQFAML